MESRFFARERKAHFTVMLHIEISLQRMCTQKQLLSFSLDFAKFLLETCPEASFTYYALKKMQNLASIAYTEDLCQNEFYLIYSCDLMFRQILNKENFPSHLGFYVLSISSFQWKTHDGAEFIYYIRGEIFW